MRSLTFVATVFVLVSLACSFSTATPQPDNAQEVNEALSRLIVAGTQTKMAEPPPTLTATIPPEAVVASTDTPLPSATATLFATQTSAAPPATDTPLPTETPSPPSVGGCIPADVPLQAGLVTRIINGDTIEAFVEGKLYQVRYTGADAPSTSERFGAEAKARNQALVSGKNIVLIQDAAETDSKGLLLRYVFIDSLEGVMVNYDMLRQGYAQAISPAIACAEEFQYAEAMARQDDLGLWGLPPWYTPTPLKHRERQYDPSLDFECPTTCKP
jgi:endonuclease YncB( thermonuclease family)